MVQPQSSARQHVRVGAVIRDVIMIVVLVAVGSFIVGIIVPATLAIALSNFVFGTFGFIISGCMAGAKRWRHLLWVGFGVWLAVLINVFAFGFGIKQWLLSVFAVAIMMGLGGWLSYFFPKN
ncbi:MAG TPA: hypothetical protein VFB72_01015 [Verrucomicrobiae bacterium]|nr:hypothetical protein [Verrucomicrobiae bacterium]